ncbi:MAG: hypothetical protein Q9191_004393, partial [Dirinaria sp. TL-2023a]
MSGFAVPFSSSPPSTPDSRSRYSNGLGGTSDSFASNVSTTPAGPPPSSIPSFTPAGPPPPSSLFGSSQPASQNKLLFKANSRPFASSSMSSPPLPPPQPSGNSEIEEEADDEEMNEYSESSEGGGMEMDEADERLSPNATSTMSSKLQASASSAGGFDWTKYGSSPVGPTPRGTKRSRGGAAISPASTRSMAKQDITKESPIPAIARDMATQLGIASLNEPDDLILKSESILDQVYASTSDENTFPDHDALLSDATEEIVRVWRACRDHDLKKTPPESDATFHVGPGSEAPEYHKAAYLGALLLQLHHPPAAKGLQAYAMSKHGRSSGFTHSVSSTQARYHPTALPKVLLEWLDENHNPYQTALLNLKSHHPNPTAHGNYWDIIFSSTLRGKMSDVISIFKHSRFEYARTAREPGRALDGYHGVTLKNVKRVIDRAVQVLEMCPVQQNEDWEVSGDDWLLFRKRIEQAMADLATFAEGRNRDLEPTESTFEASNFGIKSPPSGLSQSARRAESQVPWTIYQNLRAMYGILLGGTAEIISSAQDWIEATIGLAAWWDGDDDDDIVVGSPAVTRRSLSKSQMRGSRTVDVNPTGAYIHRLASAFARITGDVDGGLFQIGSINPVEVGLACIFEGNVEGVISLLRGWSLPIATSVVEIASLGNWFGPGFNTGLMRNFDESDLLVLSSYETQREKPVTHDSLLTEYAESLFSIGNLTPSANMMNTSSAASATEGWELSIRLLSRLLDATRADRKLTELLDDLPLDSDLRVDKVLHTCDEFGLPDLSRKIAERYAASVSSSDSPKPDYGTALVFYARAHRAQKVKSILDLLVSMSLVRSMAYPPRGDLDDNLRALVDEPKDSLLQLGRMDKVAASTLHMYLTGYATLRKFYDLRDADVNLSDTGKPTAGSSWTRRKEAAKALIAVINSAADNIHGGLYDESRASIVHVDGLLALLGEATVFVN